MLNFSNTSDQTNIKQSQDIQCLQTEIASLDEKISKNKTNISTNASSINDLSDDLGSLKSSVCNNKDSINTINETLESDTLEKANIKSTNIEAGTVNAGTVNAIDVISATNTSTVVNAETLNIKKFCGEFEGNVTSPLINATTVCSGNVYGNIKGDLTSDSSVIKDLTVSKTATINNATLSCSKTTDDFTVNGALLTDNIDSNTVRYIPENAGQILFTFTGNTFTSTLKVSDSSITIVKNGPNVQIGYTQNVMNKWNMFYTDGDSVYVYATFDENTPYSIITQGSIDFTVESKTEPNDMNGSYYYPTQLFRTVILGDRTSYYGLDICGQLDAAVAPTYETSVFNNIEVNNNQTFWNSGKTECVVLNNANCADENLLSISDGLTTDTVCVNKLLYVGDTLRAKNIIADKSLTSNGPLTLVGNDFASGNENKVVVEVKDDGSSNCLNVSSDTVINGSLTSDSIITKGITNDGDLIVCGDIIQCGETKCVEAQCVYSKCDYLILRDGNTTSLSDTDYSGLTIKNYDGSNDGNIVITKDGEVRVGKSTGLEPVLTRDEKANLSDKDVLIWDADNNRAVTTDVYAKTQYVDDCILAVNECISCVNKDIEGVSAHVDELGLDLIQCISDTETALTTEIQKKQDILTSLNAGTDIDITDSVISYCGTCVECSNLSNVSCNSNMVNGLSFSIVS